MATAPEELYGFARDAEVPVHRLEAVESADALAERVFDPKGHPMLYARTHRRDGRVARSLLQPSLTSTTGHPEIVAQVLYRDGSEVIRTRPNYLSVDEVALVDSHSPRLPIEALHHDLAGDDESPIWLPAQGVLFVLDKHNHMTLRAIARDPGHRAALALRFALGIKKK